MVKVFNSICEETQQNSNNNIFEQQMSLIACTLSTRVQHYGHLYVISGFVCANN